MSQFNFPRINFHGSVLLDVGTANNGRFHPLRVYNQNSALPYAPPRVYLTSAQVAYIKKSLPQYKVVTEKEESYVVIDTVSSPDIFVDWAQWNLGTSDIDKDFKPLYDYVVLAEYKITEDSTNWIQPGYWNYFGDMSVYTEDVRITGVQLPNGNGVNTWTPGNTEGCPDILEQMLNTSLSFHSDFFAENPRSSAVFCDVDSVGQTCTQMFYGKAGIYDDSNGKEKSFFEGKPCKSTFNWMTLSKVLNWMDPSLMPISGATYFYSTIDLTTCDPELQALLNTYAGENVTALSMKISVHEVYEVHNPDYSTMPRKGIGNSRTTMPKNPARVAFSGSICPFVEGDMKTNTIARILKNPKNVHIPICTDNKIKVPPVKIKGKFINDKLTMPKTVQLPPCFLNHDKKNNLISLDIINTVPEYGTDLGEPYDYGGDTSIPPFTKFENYDLGTLSLYYLPDGSNVPTLIGTLNHTNDYNYTNFINVGGVFNFSVSPQYDDYTNGLFYLEANGLQIAKEDDFLFLSDQQGSYAEQFQDNSEGYMSDGLPKGPVFIRVFKRGVPVKKEENYQGYVQYVGNGEPKPITVYDGMTFQYPVDTAGCYMYAFYKNPDQSFDGSLYALSNSYFITTRVLEHSTKLASLLEQPELSFNDIYDNVLANYHTVLPIMSAILPFNEKTWREPWVLRRMLQMIDEKSWNGPLYMPVTRELSTQQRQLLQKWAGQIL